MSNKVSHCAYHIVLLYSFTTLIVWLLVWLLQVYNLNRDVFQFIFYFLVHLGYLLYLLTVPAFWGLFVRAIITLASTGVRVERQVLSGALYLHGCFQDGFCVGFRALVLFTHGPS